MFKLRARLVKLQCVQEFPGVTVKNAGFWFGQSHQRFCVCNHSECYNWCRRGWSPCNTQISKESKNDLWSISWTALSSWTLTLNLVLSKADLIHSIFFKLLFGTYIIVNICLSKKIRVVLIFTKTIYKIILQHAFYNRLIGSTSFTIRTQI